MNLLVRIVITFIFFALLQNCGYGQRKNALELNLTIANGNSEVLLSENFRVNAKLESNFILISWVEQEAASYYDINLILTDGSEVSVASGLIDTTHKYYYFSKLGLWQLNNSQVRVSACSSSSNCVTATKKLPSNITSGVTRLASDFPDVMDSYGWEVDLSADGKTLVIGDYLESSNAIGINGDQNNNLSYSSGAAYVYQYNEISKSWTQSAYLKANTPSVGYYFGQYVRISSDGATIAVAAPHEDSAASGVGGNQLDSSMRDSGAVYIFSLNNSGEWAQTAYIKASNTGQDDFFGLGMDLSADGTTLVVGSPDEDSNDSGLNANQNDDSLQDSGAVYVFNLDPTTQKWQQNAYIKASNPGLRYKFGERLSISDDGKLLAVGSKGDANNATGTSNVSPANDDSKPFSGAVYIYSNDGNGNWQQTAYIKSDNSEEYDFFGAEVRLSGDGNFLVVGAAQEDSNSRGISESGSPNNDALSSGAVYVFQFKNNEWVQMSYIKASNTGSHDNFGVSLSINKTGNYLAVGASGEASRAIGIGGIQNDNNMSKAGAAYYFKRTENDTWQQVAYIKSTYSKNNSRFGNSLSMSDDGKVLAVGANWDDYIGRDSNSSSQTSTIINAGAVYIY